MFDNARADEDVRDPCVAAWERYLMSREGQWAVGVQLTNGVDATWGREYDLVGELGVSVGTAWRERASIASALGVPVHRLMLERATPSTRLCVARVKILDREPVTGVRWSTGPAVVAGVMTKIGRMADGRGDASLTIHQAGLTVPTAVVGPSGSGKTEAVRLMAVNVGETMNLLYADPSGDNDAALRRCARVSVVGEENVLRLPNVVRALLRRREGVRNQLGVDALDPAGAVPGWMVIHEEISVVCGQPARRGWTQVLCDTPTDDDRQPLASRLGVWPVATNYSLDARQWGCRALFEAWCQQVLAFGGARRTPWWQALSSPDVGGLMCQPNDLPRSGDRWVPGVAVQTGVDTPVVLDLVAGDSTGDGAAQRIAAGPTPPSHAVDAALKMPDVHPVDHRVLVEYFGEPVGGRWDVSPDGTHGFLR